MENKFNIPDTISRAIDILKENAAFLILTPVLYWVASNMVGNVGSAGITNELCSSLLAVTRGEMSAEELAATVNSAQLSLFFSPFFWFGILLTWVLQVFYKVGYMRFQLQAIDNKELSANSFCTKLDIYLQYFLTTLCYGIIVCAGTMLCVLPGIYLAIRLLLAPYYVIDRQMDCMTAIKTCWNDMSGQWWMLLLALLLFLLINIGGFMACCVGLLVTQPITELASALIYRSISSDRN